MAFLPVPLVPYDVSAFCEGDQKIKSRGTVLGGIFTVQFGILRQD